MKELVEVIATSLVDHPEEVVVTETVTDKSIVLELKVAPDDMGDDLIEISHGMICGNFPVLYIKEGKRWKNICA